VELEHQSPPQLRQTGCVSVQYTAAWKGASRKDVDRERTRRAAKHFEEAARRSCPSRRTLEIYTKDPGSLRRGPAEWLGGVATCCSAGVSHPTGCPPLGTTAENSWDLSAPDLPEVPHPATRRLKPGVKHRGGVLSTSTYLDLRSLQNSRIEVLLGWIRNGEQLLLSTRAGQASA
jgi:hypothetical protein